MVARLSYNAHLSELELRILPCGKQKSVGYDLPIFWMVDWGLDYASFHLER
jgi:hypothetical protein